MDHRCHGWKMLKIHPGENRIASNSVSLFKLLREGPPPPKKKTMSRVTLLERCVAGVSDKKPAKPYEIEGKSRRKSQPQPRCLRKSTPQWRNGRLRPLPARNAVPIKPSSRSGHRILIRLFRHVRRRPHCWRVSRIGERRNRLRFPTEMASRFCLDAIDGFELFRLVILEKLTNQDQLPSPTG